VTCQRLCILLRVPVRMVLPLCLMVTFVSVNMAMQFASHSCPANSSDVVPRSGKICAAHVATGKFGKSNSAVCIACFVS